MCKIFSTRNGKGSLKKTLFALKVVVAPTRINGVQKPWIALDIHILVIWFPEIHVGMTALMPIDTDVPTHHTNKTNSKKTNQPSPRTQAHRSEKKLWQPVVILIAVAIGIVAFIKVQGRINKQP